MDRFNLNKFNNTLFLILFTGLVAGVIACDRIEEEISADPGLQLVYSTDTVKFDTILSERGSISKSFRLYNPNKNAISIDRIYLAMGDGSAYNITVGGKKQSEVEDEVIFGNDSLLVLVDVFIDPADEDLPFLVKDSVVVEYNQNRQNVKLVSWGQDAHYFDREIIACDAVWTAGKPYVIYDTVLVAENCVLTIEEGAKILMDNNSALAILGSLQINGSAENKVEIRNSRLDPYYDIAPGQWNAILFLEGSHDNMIDHAEIKNGVVGLRVGSPDDNKDYDLVVSNTSISHMSSSGLLAFSSDVYLYNTEIFDCGNELVGNYIGGNYRYEHCTFSNEPNSFIRDQASVILADNIQLGDGSSLVEDLDVLMTNSIIWGNQDEELLFSATGNANVTLVINNNVIKSENDDWVDLGNTISQATNYPGFYAPSLFNYQLDSLSPARDSANVSDIRFDLLGTERDVLPDLGAYERKDSIP
ncbi:MAG: hypothetical protein OCD76_12215 [Reichenbachiella sp.]